MENDEQLELNNIYELICTGELNNVELAFELIKNYDFDFKNWRNFFIEKSKRGIIYKDVLTKLDKLRNIGYNYDYKYFTNEKALKFYNDSGKFNYYYYSSDMIKIECKDVTLILTVKLDSNNKVIIAPYRHYYNYSLSTIDQLKNYSNDILNIIGELENRNIFQEYHNNNDQREFYSNLEKFIRRLYDNISSNFQSDLIRNKLLYDWNNKTGDKLKYEYGSGLIELTNLHSNKTKFTVKYYRAKNYSPKVTGSRRIDLLIRDYGNYIIN